LFLADSLPGLCYTCHTDVQKDIDTNRVVHQAVKDSIRCSNCHSPHASDEKKLLTAEKKALCLNCHDREREVNGRKTKNIRKLLAESKVIHPAINGGCTSCHKPHASPENYLLISAVPAELYVAGKRDNYAVCWECHDSDLLELAETETATNFRNGAKNLHSLHLKGPRGRSCVLCHDVHASNSKYLILDKIAFGKWSFTMNFAPADSGGSCSPGCHGFTSYKR
jgi:predicted CXXCH cytochrome family protein